MIHAGIDILLAQAPFWKKQRIGLVTNNAAVTAEYTASREALLQQGYHIVKLFSPEHGLDTMGPDGQFMQDGMDALTGLPVISLYGSKLAPGGNDLEDIDLLLVDLPDIGSRFYTYLWTLSHVMEAAALHGRPLLVLDRPNPLSGRLDMAEGPLLDEAHAASFIGRWHMPLRHSCTLGELALYFNMVRKIGAGISVVRCEGWNRHTMQPEWGTSFVPASPAINCFEAALLYPGLCFLEATNVSEGRGTATPFRVAGAPWFKPAETAALFNACMADGVKAREVSFTPESGKYAGMKCRGLMLHVRDAAVFRPVAAGLMLLKIIKDIHPGDFAWAPYRTLVNGKGEEHLKLLAGRPEAAALFEQPWNAFVESLAGFTTAGGWAAEVEGHLLY